MDEKGRGEKDPKMQDCHCTPEAVRDGRSFHGCAAPSRDDSRLCYHTTLLCPALSLFAVHGSRFTENPKRKEVKSGGELMRKEFDECRSNLVSGSTGSPPRGRSRGRIWVACVVAMVMGVWSEKVGNNSSDRASSNQPRGGSGSWGQHFALPPDAAHVLDGPEVVESRCQLDPDPLDAGGCLN